MSNESSMGVTSLWHRYSAAWSLEAETRDTELPSCRIDEVTYADPGDTVTSVANLSSCLAQFQRSVPGDRFEMVAVAEHHDRSLARWHLRDEQAQLLTQTWSTSPGNVT